MRDDHSDLDHLKAAYKVAVEAWLTAIRQEEELVSGVESVADVDKWEGAHFHEEEIRGTVKAAKKEYENALRKKFFQF